MVYMDINWSRNDPDKRPIDLRISFIADKKNHPPPVLVLIKGKIDQRGFFKVKQGDGTSKCLKRYLCIGLSGLALCFPLLLILRYLKVLTLYLLLDLRCFQVLSQ